MTLGTMLTCLGWCAAFGEMQMNVTCVNDGDPRRALGKTSVRERIQQKEELNWAKKAVKHARPRNRVLTVKPEHYLTGDKIGDEWEEPVPKISEDAREQLFLIYSRFINTINHKPISSSTTQTHSTLRSYLVTSLNWTELDQLQLKAAQLVWVSSRVSFCDFVFMKGKHAYVIAKEPPL